VQGLVTFVKTLGPARLAAMGAVTAAMIGFFAFLILRVTAPVMTPLFTDLSLEDSAAIIKDLERQSIPYELKNDGAVILVRDLDEAVGLADTVAAEHLELAVADPEPLAARIRHAGAIFVGMTTPEAIGDYVAGSNHVLPTARSARFSSGLGVLDFMKRTTILGCTRESLGALGETAATLADAEGLAAHARSIRIRLNK